MISGRCVDFDYDLLPVYSGWRSLSFVVALITLIERHNQTWRRTPFKIMEMKLKPWCFHFSSCCRLVASKFQLNSHFFFCLLLSLSSLTTQFNATLLPIFHSHAIHTVNFLFDFSIKLQINLMNKNCSLNDKEWQTKRKGEHRWMKSRLVWVFDMFQSFENWWTLTFE